MFLFLRRNPIPVAIGLALGIALRLWFVLKHPVIPGDAGIYAEIARNLLREGVYGLFRGSVIVPTLIRLPGYPLFLAGCFKLFGDNGFRAPMIVHLVVDLLSCVVIADTARRLWSDRAAKIAFVMAAVCPFTANYVATGLTETLELFFTALAVDFAIIAFDRKSLGWWAACGIAVAGAIQLRPDGGLLLGAIGLVILWEIYKRRSDRKHLFTAGVVLAVVSLAPLVPWTIRNWRAWHVFQPLVTMSASDPDEFVPKGWNRWVTTWTIDYASTEDLTFHVSSENIDMTFVPNRAFDSEQERQYVKSLFDQYNVGVTMTPALDQKFGELARQKIRQHPVRFYVLLPLARLVDVWFRPRTEMLPLDTHFWQFKIDHRNSTWAFGLAALNLAWIVSAVMGMIYRRDIRYLALFTVYPILRSLLLMKMAAIEDRYTLECFPAILVLSAIFWARRGKEESAQAEIT